MITNIVWNTYVNPHYRLHVEISYQKDVCYFCHRTEEEWGEVASSILEKVSDKLISRNESYIPLPQRVDSSIQQFKDEHWSKMDHTLKMATMCSDVKRFLPDKLKICLEDLEREISEADDPTGERFPDDLNQDEIAEWIEEERKHLEENAIQLLDSFGWFEDVQGYSRYKKDIPDNEVCERLALKIILSEFPNHMGETLGKMEEEVFVRLKDILLSTFSKMHSYEHEDGLKEREEKALAALQDTKFTKMNTLFWKPLGAGGMLFNWGRENIPQIVVGCCPLCKDRYVGGAENDQGQW